MLSAARSRTALIAFAGASLVGVLSGCSSTSGTATSPGDAATPEASSPASSGTTSDQAAGSSDGAYKDGTYTETGSYSSPGGQETISVTLTIASDAVSKVAVKTVKADPTATQYQSQFIGGISSVVVGKKIDELAVSQVAGSSLTSQGFNSALTKIKADAKA